MVAFRLDFKAGDLIEGKFQIVKSLGSGSYGDVYLVEDRHNRYAMKILRLYDEPSEMHNNLVQYFKQEYETAQMPGEYFVHSLAYSDVKGNPFFTMEYCSKGDLLHYVGKNTALLPRLAHNILAGLYDLHSAGKIHRDLKPENVLIRENGKAALTDFGSIGNMNVKKRLSHLNLFGRPKTRFGTPLYMAPEMEKLKGGGITYLPTIDIFSFGVMFYELLTQGKFPFGNPKDLSELPLYQTNAQKGKWNRQCLRETAFGRDWLPIIERCIEANYQDRYQNVLEILHDIKPLMGTDAPQPIVGQDYRSANISRLIITQGEETGRTYRLMDFISNKRMIRVGRSQNNDIILKDNIDTYVSRYHFTLELSLDNKYWLIKDGQWSKEERQWLPSTNGTFLNASRANTNGLRVFSGDIITAGEYKLKIE